MNSFTCVCSLRVFCFLLTEDCLALACVQSHINGEGVQQALCSSALRWCVGVECWGRHQRQELLTGQTDANPEPKSCHTWLLPGVLVSQNWLFGDSFLPRTECTLIQFAGIGHLNNHSSLDLECQGGNIDMFTIVLTWKTSPQKSTDYSCKSISIDNSPGKNLLSSDSCIHTPQLTGGLSVYGSERTSPFRRVGGFFLMQSFYFSIWFCF